MKENVRLFRAKDLQPLHEVEDFKHYQQLVNSLANGWKGGPLLGVEAGGKIRLLTGSHRYAAAALYDLDIPVYVMALSPDQLDKATEGFQDDREKIVNASGDKEAIRLFKKELREGR
jgi:hypothetical protein